ncbi:type III polyketide synthase [Geobacillus thermodenitrificans]|uniref:type III polyketide synthase n=1 Tax=Geobacillus thermodenitrificans TaxID=33940 RepID=UPI0004152BC8|nr:3-oxoacyl-[acyl-carrier-protein] synthase III C-terminal domain-containing protein [Geobacillus thermodenitrificans]ARA96871.1 type III polyketide synthase [Geobacillus thermodenitrificans]
MPILLSIGTAKMPYMVSQHEVKRYVAELFAGRLMRAERLLQAFDNGGIRTRTFVKPLAWYSLPRGFGEKNEVYIDSAVRYSGEAVNDCLHKASTGPIPYEAVDVLFYISTTGLSTPSIEARLMNVLPFSPSVVRVPIWGLGCAGGAAGLARAADYCRAFPNAKALVIAVEFCSLTFQANDLSKSNVIGTSLFSDGVACVLVAGDEAAPKSGAPRIIAARSVLMPRSEDVMGWDIRDEGLFVIFSKDIPSIVRSWLRPQVESFLQENKLLLSDLRYFIAHPGGKKVIEAYEEAFGFGPKQTEAAREVLAQYGNMSSATVYFVLEQVMQKPLAPGYGLLVALGPGFSAEMVLLKWEG